MTEVKYDLEKRTTSFSESAIEFANSIKRTAVTTPLIVQFVRSATSVGANHLEADDAISKKEFSYRINICKREARESKYWLRLIVTSDASTKLAARALYAEAGELYLIFAKIFRSSKVAK